MRTYLENVENCTHPEKKARHNTNNIVNTCFGKAPSSVERNLDKHLQKRHATKKRAVMSTKTNKIFVQRTRLFLF